LHGKYPDIVIGAKLSTMCRDKSKSADELVRECYSVYTLQNRGKIEVAIDELLNAGVLVPQFKNGYRRYKYNNGVKE